MNIIALDTALGACSVAAGYKDANGTVKLAAHAYEERERGHAEVLFVMARSVLAEAGMSGRDIERIVVTTGPGSFTGVRIALAAARGLALATGAEIATTTSLHLLALTARSALAGAGSERPLLAAVDARRDQLYLQLFASDCTLLSPPIVANAASAAGLWPGSPVIAVGTGGGLLQTAAAECGRKLDVALAFIQPDARHLLAANGLVRPESPRPLYLRAPDAKPQAGKAIARQTQ